MSQDTTTIAHELLDELSATVLRIGALLEGIGPEDLADWVEQENIPISSYTLERIKAMAWVHQMKPNGKLPEPWKALWSLD